MVGKGGQGIPQEAPEGKRGARRRPWRRRSPGRLLGHTAPVPRLLVTGPSPCLPLLVAFAREARERGWSAEFAPPEGARAARLLGAAGEGVARERGARAASAPSEVVAGALAFARGVARVDTRWTRAALAREEARLRRAAAEIEAVLRRTRPDRVVVWNGLAGSGAVVAGAARARGIPVLHLENGFFPGTLQASYAGVNAGSGLAAVPDPVLAVPGAGAEEAYRAAVAAVRDGPAWEGDALHALAPKGSAALDRALRWAEEGPITGARLGGGARRALRARSDEARAAGAPPRGPYVLLALQVGADTQIVLHGGGIERAADAVAPVARAVAEASGGEVGLAVRPHPLDPEAGRARKEAARVGAAVAGGALGPWIDGARAVVVVNSTVGFESLARGVGVLALGRAAYGRAGVAEVAPGGEGLGAALVRAGAGPGPLARGFLAVAYRDFSVPGARDRVFGGTWDALFGALERGRDPGGEGGP